MTKEFETKTTIPDRNEDLIKTYLRRRSNGEVDAEALTDQVKSMCEQASLYRTECVGFGERAETAGTRVKDFGETAVEVQDKVLRFMVADTSTIELENEDGVPELYAFDKMTLRELGQKLEGVPVVVGNGHDADLPLAYFTKEFEVAEKDDGHSELYVSAKLREDADAPINFEELIQNPEWNVNGGEKQLSGSLRFDSFDVPYFFDNGSKINFMTRTVPRHYALVDIPRIKASGLVEKNFSKEVENMTEEQTTEVTTQSEVEVQTEETTEAPVEAPVEETVVEAEAEVEATEAATEVADEPEAVEATEAEAPEADETAELKARLAEVEAQLRMAREAEIMNKILVKALGPDYTEKEATAFVEAKLKNFGENELKGFLAGMGEATGPATKDLGRGKLDTETGDAKAPKLDLSYFKKN